MYLIFNDVLLTSAHVSAQWASVEVKGSGPCRKKIKSVRGLLGSLFEKWDKFYVSLDVDCLYLFENKTTTSAWFSISLWDVEKVTEHPHSKKMKASGNQAINSTKTPAENANASFYAIIVTTKLRDQIMIRYN